MGTYKNLHENEPCEEQVKGRFPVKGRESVLKRLKQYQTELAMQRGQPVMWHEEPAAERKK